MHRPYDRIVILYGSETGNAQDLAKIIAWTLSKLDKTLKCDLMSCDEYEMQNLPNEKFILFICSTTGIGEEPLNMKKFWRFLLRRDLPNDSLKLLHFAVIGLGDSSYQKYNFVAKKLHKRLLTLGAHNIFNYILGDDQHELGPFSTIDPWLKNFYHLVCPNVADEFSKRIDFHIEPSFDVTFIYNGENVNRDETYSDVVMKNEYNDLHPYISRVIRNDRVTSNDHFQDVRLMSLSIDDSVSYNSTDVCVIYPQNSDEDVEMFLSMFSDDRFNAERKFRLKANSNCWISKKSYYYHLISANNPCRVYDLVKIYLDIKSIPKRSFFDLFYRFSQNELERDKLKRFASGEDLDEFYDYVNRPKRTILEVMLDFPNTTPNVPFEYIFDLIPAIRPRPYSIASSPLVSPKSIDILYSVVNYRTRLRKPRLGLCTNWMVSLENEAEVSIYIRPSSFQLPTPDSQAPLMMISAGTGVAPFRAFIHERTHLILDNNYLFFGCRYSDRDYYLKEEWKTFIDKGLLNVYTAFSRDDPTRKVYVQHRLWDERALVYRLLIESNGHILVAGKSEQYPQLVRETIVNIIKEFGKGDENAEALVTRLETRRRIQYECW